MPSIAAAVPAPLPIRTSSSGGLTIWAAKVRVRQADRISRSYRRQCSRRCRLACHAPADSHTNSIYVATDIFSGNRQAGR